MDDNLYKGALDLLLSRVKEYGKYNGYDALREYVNEHVIDDLDDSTDEQIESYVYNLFNPFSDFLRARNDLDLTIDNNLNCTPARSKTRSRRTSRSPQKDDLFSFDEGFEKLERNDAIRLEKAALFDESNEDYEKAFKSFSVLYDYYTQIHPNAEKSLAMLKKKANTAKNLERVDSYEYFCSAADLLSLRYKHDEAGKLYETAYNELKKQSPARVTNLAVKKVTMLRKARLQHHTSGDNKNTSRLFILENEEERMRTKSKSKFFYKYLSNYGESPALVACWMLGVILLWSFIYYSFDINIPTQTTFICSDQSVNGSSLCLEQGNVPEGKANFLTYIYFSTVTFTTLGYGDYSPLEGWSRFFASFQAIIGLILSSLFIVTFVRRFSR
ncbi:potassium channel family protein [Vibrio brasiliensis]|uniref:potassium channel family protein n=1 Tax=Vibrio brasiliensis TaxID=170652 RepID=UPI001EFD31CD|nr:potassium channel family protein [Vibrio brasiliensis]MCG9753047.1 potassium channel family protein [Vibrio brasiliensis]